MGNGRVEVGVTGETKDLEDIRKIGLSESYLTR